MDNTELASAKTVASLAKSILDSARKSFHRHCIILAGNQSWGHGSLQEIALRNSLGNLLIVATTPVAIPGSEQINPADAAQYLGREFEHVVMDFYDGIDPNALGALSGTVSGGGLLILLMPGLDNLRNFADPEQHRMAIWPHGAQQVGNRFLQRLQNIIAASNDVTLIQENRVQENRAPPEPIYAADFAHLEGYRDDDTCRTLDQQQAVEAIEHVVRGHRRRPLVITANRGRGKSAALGIAAARLLQQGIPRIIVTGPRINATAMVFKHAQILLNDAQHSPGSIVTDTGRLEYIAPDVLCREAPACNLLLIDEAATIPVTLLQRLLQHYARIVFATTTNGYEGTGRGFTIKFQETLNRETPGWLGLEMNLPIRWAPDDPVERFVFQCLCLDANISDAGFRLDPQAVVIKKLDRDTLIDNDKLLSALFGLLVFAHYQTQPRDLRYLLDAIGLDIFIASYNDTVIGTAVVELEGGLDKTTADAVYGNQRRVMGHLLPQTLESFAGIRYSSQAKYARIIRIAVHPDFRRRGIGRQLVQHVETNARQRRLDLVGSTFGASSELLNFWQSNAYLPVHVGLKHNAATGTHAITYIKALSNEGGKVFGAAISKFNDRFTFLLSDAYRGLECDVVAAIYKTFAKDDRLHLAEDEWNDIASFATAARGYEINAPPITKLIAYLFEHNKIDRICAFDEQCLLIKKVLQRLAWQDIAPALGMTGKRDAVQQLREVLARIVSDESIKNRFGITD